MLTLDVTFLGGNVNLILTALVLDGINIGVGYLLGKLIGGKK